MSLELFIEGPDGPPRRVPLERDQLAVGRADGNDLCFADDASLSRWHLELERRGENWFVRDRRSKNGTLLNGVRVVGEERLRPHDRINAGQVTLTIVDPALPLPDNRVVFVPEPATPLRATDTVLVTSLDGLLSGETTAPGQRASGRRASEESRRVFESPVVRALIRAGRELAQHRPLDELFQLILDLSIEAVSAERGLVMTLEGDQLVPRAVHGESFRISTTVRDRVVQEKASLLVRDTQQEEALRAQQSIYQQRIRSLMAAPLQTENRVIGLVYVDATALGRTFEPDDLNLLTVLANVAAIRIEQEQFAELRRQEERRTLDLQQAAEIQAGILPKGPPEIAGFDVAGHNRPCRTVGGDYYDFIPCRDGRLAVLVGDVAGKGMSAAILMSNLQARAQHLCEEVADPATLLGKLDRWLAVKCPVNRYVTLFAGLLDTGDGTLTFSNAAHNRPLLVRASGGLERLDSMGTMLGVLPELGYDEGRVTLEPGDLLAVFSDGVTEATSADDEEFGEARLAELLVSARHRPAAEIIARVNDAVREFTGGRPAEDDVTLVLVRRLASAARA